MLRGDPCDLRAGLASSSDTTRTCSSCDARDGPCSSRSRAPAPGRSRSIRRDALTRSHLRINSDRSTEEPSDQEKCASLARAIPKRFRGLPRVILVLLSFGVVPIAERLISSKPLVQQIFGRAPLPLRCSKFLAVRMVRLPSAFPLIRGDFSNYVKKLVEFPPCPFWIHENALADYLGLR